MNRKLVISLGAAAIIGLIALFFYGIYFASDPKSIPSALIGTKATDFTTITFLEDRQITLSQFKGKPVIVNFWASWCVACRQEAHIIEAAHQRWTPKGAVFIGIAINDERAASLGFIAKYGKSYLLAPDDLTGNISLNYGVTAVPETFFVDPEGIIRHKVLGAVNGRDIDQFISKYIQ
ncbi:MAG: TlpA disulfide reductase family protein [SAR324 cluster bacterium]|nr:TlpA disulfide reductase family protein [SAR324 cluster bacterium]